MEGKEGQGMEEQGMEGDRGGWTGVKFPPNSYVVRVKLYKTHITQTWLFTLGGLKI